MLWERSSSASSLPRLLVVLGRDLQFPRPGLPLPLAGSELAALDTLTGELASRWDWHRSASLLVYGRRRVEAPLRASSSSFINERFGVGVRFGGRRTPAVDVVAEAGSDDYEARRGAVEPRRDDVVAYGVSIAFEVRDFTFRIATLRTEYDSTLPEFDREITSLNASFELLGFLQKKLRIGEDDRVW